jgi:tetratricopeptide (TPR) repeat protein
MNSLHRAAFARYAPAVSGRNEDRRPSPIALANDLLDGRKRPSVPLLLEAIARVNPTGHVFEARERDRRYQLKAKLQSLLLRRFQDALELVAESPDLVLIRSRHDAGPSTHAVLETLDDDARSWVRLQLDLAAPESPPEALRPRSGRGPATVDEDALHLGNRALQEYDFEQARRMFEKAVAGDGSAASAGALLSLLVDVLGLDQDASDAYLRLATQARNDPEVVVLAAVAWVRLGQWQQALRAVEPLGLARAEDVIVDLARAALTADDADTARAALLALRSRTPSPSALRGLDEGLAQRRDRQWEARKGDVASCLETGRFDEATRQVKEFLAKHPDSLPARRTLEEAAALRRVKEATGLVEQASALASRGEDSLALGLLVRALGGGLQGTDREHALSLKHDIEQRQRTQQREARVSETTAALTSDLPKGLALYLGLDDQARAAVRERSDRVHLGWLESMVAHGTGAKRAIEAVRALARAIDRGPSVGLVSLLEPFERDLDPIEQARTLLALSRDCLHADRERTLDERLRLASEALEAGNLESVTRLLDPETRVGMTSAQRASATQLLAQADARARGRAFHDELDGLIRSGRLIEARRKLIDLGGPTERDGKLCTNLEKTVALQWRISVDVVTDGGSAAAPPEDTFLDLDLQGAGETECLLSRDGAWVFLLSIRQQWVFIRQIDTSTGEVRTRVVLHTPMTLTDPTVHVDGESLHIISPRAYLEMSIVRWTIERWVSIEALLGESRVVEGISLAPGGRYLWISRRHVEQNFAASRLGVLDIHTNKILEQGVSRWAYQAYGTDDPCVVSKREGQQRAEFDVLQPRGTGTWPVALRTGVSVVAAGSSPEGALALLGMNDSPGDSALELQVVSQVVPHQGAGTATRIRDADTEFICSMATSRRFARIFIVFQDFETRQWIAACQGGVAGLAEFARERFPRDATLVQDAGAQRVFALRLGERGIKLVEVGKSLPGFELGEGQDVTGSWDHRVPGGTRCDNAPMTPEELREAAEEQANRSDDAVGRDLDSALAALVLPRRRSWNTNEKTALELDPLSRLYAAKDASLDHDWARVRSLLVDTDPGELPDVNRRHFHCLLGRSLIYAGDTDAAFQELLKARDHPGKCQLDPWLRVVEPLPEVDTCLAHHLRRLVGQADARIKARDFRGAVDVLAGRRAWQCNEPQVLARLAEALLWGVAKRGPERFTKAIGLASFLVSTHRHTGDVPSLPLGPIWTTDRMTDLVSRAKRWLEEAE